MLIVKAQADIPHRTVRLQLLEADGRPADRTTVRPWSRGVQARLLPNQPEVDQPWLS